MWVSSVQATWRMSANSFEVLPFLKKFQGTRIHYLVSCTFNTKMHLKVHSIVHSVVLSVVLSILFLKPMVYQIVKRLITIVSVPKISRRIVKLDFWFEFGRRIARSCRARRSRWRLSRGGTDVGWFSNWNFWLYPTTKIEKNNIRKKKAVFAEFISSRSCSKLTNQRTKWEFLFLY